jgi:hypothetical protein
VSIVSEGVGSFRTCLVAAGLLTALAGGCGKKGPPLPPLVRVPEAPPEVVAGRRGDRVDIRVRVPSSNTDGTRPANIARLDVYAITGPAGLSDSDLLRYGTRIDSLQVKSPRDPDNTIDPDEPEADLEPLEGPGLDQGATVSVSEELAPIALSVASPAGPEVTSGSGPLLGPPEVPPRRSYAAVGVNKSGRRGPVSKWSAVPLLEPPARPLQPEVIYDETVITVRWAAVVAATGAATGVLPSRPLTPAPESAIGYHVYDVTAGEEIRLTRTPSAEPGFADERIEWGAERCYTVRSTKTIDGLTVEGDAAPRRCVTLVDRFAPAPPTGLQTVASEGAIYLIWNGNGEKDLAGYIVLRGTSPDGLTPITAAPIQATTLRDAVTTPFEGFYAVQAVDRAGNMSGMSAVVAETAR